VENPHFLYPTMTVSESKCGPFKLVSHQKSAKKPQTEQVEWSEVKHRFETSIQIIFKKPTKHGTEIHVAANVKEFIHTMMKFDPALSVISLDREVAYHPSNDKFPKLEDKFKKNFMLHEPAPTQPPATTSQLAASCARLR